MGRTIVIVDDDFHFRALMKRCLLRINKDFSFHEFGDGEAVLNTVNKENLDFDLMLLDLNMPRVGGFKVLEEFRGKEKYKEKPILLLTVSTSESDRDKAIALGASAFISKPVGLDELENEIANICSEWL